MPVTTNAAVRGAATELGSLFNLESERGSRTIGLQAEAIKELISNGSDLLKEARGIAEEHARGGGPPEMQLAGIKAFQRLNMEPPGLARISTLLDRVPTDPGASPADIVTITKAGTAVLKQLTDQVDFAVQCFEKLGSKEALQAAQKLTDALTKTLSGVVERSEERITSGFVIDVTTAVRDRNAITPDSSALRHTLERGVKESPTAPKSTDTQITDLKGASVEVQVLTGQVGVLLAAGFKADNRAVTFQDQAVSKLAVDLGKSVEQIAEKLAQTAKTAADERNKPKADRTVSVQVALAAVEGCAELCDSAKRWLSPAGDSKANVSEMLNKLSSIASRMEKAGDVATALEIKKGLIAALTPGVTEYRGALVSLVQDSPENVRTNSKPTGFLGFVAKNTPNWLGGKALREFVTESQDNSAHRAVGKELEKLLSAATQNGVPHSEVEKKAAQTALSTATLRETQFDKLLSFNFKAGSDGQLAQDKIVADIFRKLASELLDPALTIAKAGIERCKTGSAVTPEGFKVLLASSHELKELKEKALGFRGDIVDQQKFVKSAFERLDQIAANYRETGLSTELRDTSNLKAKLLEGKLGEFQQGMADIIADRTRIVSASGETSPLSSFQRFFRNFTAKGRQELAARDEVAEAVRAVTEIDKLSNAAPTTAKSPNAEFGKRDRQADLALAQLSAIASHTEIGSGPLRDLQLANAANAITDLYELLKKTRGDIGSVLSPTMDPSQSVEQRAAMIQGSVAMSSLSRDTVKLLKDIEGAGGTLRPEMLSKVPSAAAEIVGVLRSTAYGLDRGAAAGDVKGEDLHKAINIAASASLRQFTEGATNIVLQGGTAPESSREYQTGEKAVSILEELENLRRMGII